MNKFLWSFIVISTVLTIYNFFWQSINDGISYFVEIFLKLKAFMPIEVMGLLIYIIVLLLIKYVSQWR